MKKNILIGIVSVLLIDIIGSLASYLFEFPYTFLWPVSIANYALFGYLSSKQNKLIKNGAITGAILGLTDTTIGWKISIWLNAYSPDRDIEPTSNATLIMTIIVGTLFASLIGFFGGALNKLKKE